MRKVRVKKAEEVAEVATDEGDDDDSDLAVLQSLSPDIKAVYMLLNKKLDIVINSNKFMSRKYDELMDDIKKNNKVIADLRKEVKDKDGRIEQLEDDFHKLQQYSRVVNVEIRGVEKRANENVYELVKKVGVLNGVDLIESDISIAHRVPNGKSRIETIIVQFQNRRARESLLNAARNNNRGLFLKDLLPNVNNPNAKVYVSENLSPFYKSLLWSAQQKAKQVNFKYVWFRNGKLLVKKGDGDSEKQVIEIKSKKDIEEKMK